MVITWAPPSPFLPNYRLVRGTRDGVATVVRIPAGVPESDIPATAGPMLEERFAAGDTYRVGEFGVMVVDVGGGPVITRGVP